MKKRKSAPMVFAYKEPEKVAHPAHYGGDTPYEVIKVLRVWLTREEMIGALKFNIIKYQAHARLRDKEKPGSAAADYAKAAWYAQYLSDFVKAPA